MKQEEDPPIFMRKKVNFAPSDPIISLAISNDILILIMSNNVMLKIDLNQQDKPEGSIFIFKNIYIIFLLLYVILFIYFLQKLT